MGRSRSRVRHAFSLRLEPFRRIGRSVRNPSTTGQGFRRTGEAPVTRSYHQSHGDGTERGSREVVGENPAPPVAFQRATPTGEWVADSVLFGLSNLQWWWNGLPEVHPQIPGLVLADQLYRRAVRVPPHLVDPPVPARHRPAPARPRLDRDHVGLPTLVGVSRLALLLRPRTAVLVTGLHIACAIPYHWAVPIPAMRWEMWIVVMPLLYALALCIGLLGRSRRVIAGLREIGGPGSRAVRGEARRYPPGRARADRSGDARRARPPDLTALRARMAPEYRAASLAVPSPAEVRAAAMEAP